MYSFSLSCKCISFIHIYIHTRTNKDHIRAPHKTAIQPCFGVATVSGIDKIIYLYCRILSLL